MMFLLYLVTGNPILGISTQMEKRLLPRKHLDNTVLITGQHCCMPKVQLGLRLAWLVMPLLFKRNKISILTTTPNPLCMDCKAILYQKKLKVPLTCWAGFRIQTGCILSGQKSQKLLLVTWKKILVLKSSPLYGRCHQMNKV